MKIEGLLTAVLITTCAGATFAQAEQAPPARAAEAPAPDKKICRTERMTGSLTRSTRTCMTQAQWDQLADETNKTVSDLSRADARSDLIDRRRPLAGPMGPSR